MNKRMFPRLFIFLPFLFLAADLFPLQGRLAFSQGKSNGQEKIPLDVPYEPSAEEIVGIMIQMAEVGSQDLVYDLGCGDGRIVIAASQRTGARGVGVDLDPERIKESRENAEKANVTERVNFFQQDLFQTEIRQATVVMLYLYPEVNLRLLPKLLNDLKPGTRVVSHSHDMGAWEPDRTQIASNGHKIHFWVIPANITGTWEWEMPGEKEHYSLRLSQRFQKISGALQIGSYEIPVKSAVLRGDRVQFTVEQLSKGEGQTWRFSGQVQGHLLEGTVEGMGSQEKRPWKAKRNPSSMKPLDQ
jgi:SAM-dependent methyltransferase